MERESPATSTMRLRSTQLKAFDKSDSTLQFEMVNGTFASSISPLPEEIVSVNS